MSAVLGVSAYYHDAAAALAIDGRIVAAVQEDRLSRKKHDAGLPVRAMQACLALGELQPGDLDRVVFYENPYAKLERVLTASLSRFPRSLGSFTRGLVGQLSHKIWVLDDLARALDLPRQRIHHVEHHRSHAASAFFASPIPRAAVLTVDGVGERVTAALWRARGDELECLEELEYPHSLGLFFAAITAFVGFEVGDGEYKLMGLAGYGRPRYVEELSKALAFDESGSFFLDERYVRVLGDDRIAYGPKLEQVLGPPRSTARPWDLSTELDQRFADIAASAQWLAEEAMLVLARRLHRLADERALCLAGGVALNALANFRLQKESGFAQVFVPPAAGDAGGAVGAAYLGAIDCGDVPCPLEGAALGVHADPGAALELGRGLGLHAIRLDDPARAVAEMIGQGKIISVAEGRSEWGARALGQRSILGHPGRMTTRERINRTVKHREPFRPFAPAVWSEDAARYFEGIPNAMTPYMTTVCPVRAAFRTQELCAVTHVDGTARAQTVDDEHTLLGGILRAAENAYGMPVVLNTSLNAAGEPIVGDESDALMFFARHGTDGLLVGDVFLSKR